MSPPNNSVTPPKDPPKDPPNDVPKPQAPSPEEIPKPPVAPAAVDPAAVMTTQSGLKYGWQQAPVRTIPEPQACVHIGTVAARAQLAVHEFGHEWVCDCGQVFVVALNRGDKKTLIEKEKLASE